MNSTRIVSLTICLGLACLLLTGNALAQSTTATDVSYAQEVGAAGIGTAMRVPPWAFSGMS